VINLEVSYHPPATNQQAQMRVRFRYVLCLAVALVLGTRRFSSNHGQLVSDTGRSGNDGAGFGGSNLDLGV